MKKTRRPKLAEHDHILTAFAERRAGPGWANSPVLVIIQDGNGQLRVEWIQPDSHTADIIALFDVSEAAHRAMTIAVRAALKAG